MVVPVQPSGVTRNTGAAFLSERELSDVLACTFPIQTAKGSEVRSRREFAVGAVIPDVVYVSLRGTPVSSVLHDRWSYWDAYVMWMVRRHFHIRSDTIASKAHARPERVARVTARLVRSGALECSVSGTLKASPSYTACSAEVIAVEAKLSRWRDGLAQAIQYRKFSNRAYVALDHSRIPHQADISAFHRERIGLVAVSSSGVFVEIVRAPFRHVSTPDREYVLSSALGGHGPWRTMCERSPAAQLST